MRTTHLESKGDTVAPFVGAVQAGAQDSGADELANNEGHVDPTSQVGAQAHGQQLTSVGGGRGDEDAPRKTAEDLTDGEHDGAVCKEDDENEALEEDETSQDGQALAEAVDNVATHEATYRRFEMVRLSVYVTEAVGRENHQLTEEETYEGRVGQAGLPGSSELVAGRRLRAHADEIAVLGLEGRVGEEVGDENCIITLHDDRHTVYHRGLSACVGATSQAVPGHT